MKNTFNIWNKIEDLSIDGVTNLILTGATLRQSHPDIGAYRIFGNIETSLNILDFGCGIGRNSFGLASYSAMWNIVGYDNEVMLSRTSEYKEMHYKDIEFKNLKFETDWERVKNMKFDVIFCNLVLQHIHESALTQYLSDFKTMTSLLIVNGRRFNDEMADGKYKNTWNILEKNGYFPYNAHETNYSADGDPNHHMNCIYKIK